MDDQIFHIITWVIGTIGTVIGVLLTLWWKVEHKQDKKIDNLAKQNGDEHMELHEKIDQQHHAIRDRLDKIWAYLHRNHQ